MKLRRITSKQVAERAGVSQTTVSFVLNNVVDANISAETKERVLNAARELNYTPHEAARTLARGRSDTIALVLQQPHRQVFIDEYLPRVLTGITEVTQRAGFRILVEQVGADNGSTVFRRLLQSREAAGAIINFGSPPRHDIDYIIDCTANGMPIVALDHIDPAVYSVTVDKVSGVRIIVQHLIDLGYRRIACITYDDQQTHVHERLEMFHSTMIANQLQVDPALIRWGKFDPETGYAAMQSILSQAAPLPDAVYAMNDVMAFGAIRAIRERGLRVPEDIAVVGFDDVRLAGFCNPPLTTMNEPDEEHGRKAAEMLIALLTGNIIDERHVTLHTRLIVRDSCGALLKK